MMIPRERKLVRIYVELPPSVAVQYREEQDGEILMKQVAKVMQPYMMETKHIEWSTTYTVHAFPKIPPLLQDQELTDPSRLVNESVERSGCTTASFWLVMRSTHILRRQAKE